VSREEKKRKDTVNKMAVTITISDKEMETYVREGRNDTYVNSLKAKSCDTCRTVFSYEGLEERRAEKNIAYNCPNCEGLGKLRDYKEGDII
jgi:excinuclease UvrABC ATPase subunit